MFITKEAFVITWKQGNLKYSCYDSILDTEDKCFWLISFIFMFLT